MVQAPPLLFSSPHTPCHFLLQQRRHRQLYLSLPRVLPPSLGQVRECCAGAPSVVLLVSWKRAKSCWPWCPTPSRRRRRRKRMVVLILLKREKGKRRSPPLPFSLHTSCLHSCVPVVMSVDGCVGSMRRENEGGEQVMQLMCVPLISLLVSL